MATSPSVSVLTTAPRKPLRNKQSVTSSARKASTTITLSPSFRTFGASWSNGMPHSDEAVLLGDSMVNWRHSSAIRSRAFCCGVVGAFSHNRPLPAEGENLLPQHEQHSAPAMQTFPHPQTSQLSASAANLRPSGCCSVAAVTGCCPASQSSPHGTGSREHFSLVRRHRSPSSVIHWNSQPWRAQRARRRASFHSSDTTLGGSVTPRARSVARTQRAASSLRAFLPGGLSPLGNTNAQKPHRAATLPAVSPSEENSKSRLSPGTSSHFQPFLPPWAESAGPNASRHWVFIGFGCLKTKVTSDMARRMLKSALIISSAAMLALWSSVPLRSKTHSALTPAS
mmetsp:Transcript_115198/g.321000  ORF Transcript_115198/g.321000 Transcript_115198/m.321000 type:complete len:340 (+) Transcript_115198:148-1167(+)